MSNMKHLNYNTTKYMARNVEQRKSDSKITLSCISFETPVHDVCMCVCMHV